MVDFHVHVLSFGLQNCKTAVRSTLFSYETSTLSFLTSNYYGSVWLKRMLCAGVIRVKKYIPLWALF